MTDRSDASLFTHVYRYGLAMILPGLLSLGLVSVFTREFSPSAFGRYSLVLSVALVTSTVLTGWLEQAVLRFEPEQPRTVTGNATIILVVLFAAFGLAAASFFPVVAPQLGPLSSYYFPGVALIMSTSMFNVFRAVHQSRLSSDYVSLAKILRAIVRAVASLSLALVVLQSIAGWLWGAALATGLVALSFGWRADAVDAVRAGFDRSLVGRMAAFGFPLIGWALAHNLLNFSDRFIIEFVRGSAEVGVYSSNYLLAARAAGIAFGPIIQAIHPMVMNDWSGSNDEELAGDIRRYTRYLLVIGAPVVAFSVVLSRPLTDLFLDPKYSTGYLVIPLVTAGLFLWNLANIGHKSLEVTERSRTMLIGVVFALVVNLVLNVPLVTTYGYFGAAVASLVGFGVYPVYVYAVTRRHIPWRIPWRRGVLAVGCTTAILLPYALVHRLGFVGLSVDLALVAPTGLLYIGVVLLTGAVSSSEVARARTFVRRLSS